MSDKSGIEWTDATWNPTRGCDMVSPGCKHCYAMKVAGRWPWGKNLVKRDSAGNVTWNGNVELVESALTKPLTWRAPRRIFVDSESDLFHEKVPDEWIAAVLGVVARARRHTFQVLTKRPARMREMMKSITPAEALACMAISNPETCREPIGFEETVRITDEWPPRNLWLGVSVEDQATADARIPVLLATPAALRFVSYEPALGPVNFDEPRCQYHGRDEVSSDEHGEEFCNECAADGSGGELSHGWWLDPLNSGIRWVIVGGESGSPARPFDVAWARSTIAQCRGAGVACFVKQVGTRPTLEKWTAAAGREWTSRGASVGEAGSILLRDRKGGDMAEWPADLRVREFPPSALDGDE